MAFLPLKPLVAGVEIFGQMSGRKAEANAQAARKHLESHQYLGSNNGGQAVMQEATPRAMWLLTNLPFEPHMSYSTM